VPKVHKTVQKNEGAAAEDETDSVENIIGAFKKWREAVQDILETGDTSAAVPRVDKEKELPSIQFVLTQFQQLPAEMQAVADFGQCRSLLAWAGSQNIPKSVGLVLPEPV
jgi:hypothetical protein